MQPDTSKEADPHGEYVVLIFIFQVPAVSGGRHGGAVKADAVKGAVTFHGD